MSSFAPRLILVTLFLAPAFLGQARAETGAGSRELESLFVEAGVEGTFVLFDPQKETITSVNPERAAQRFVPASTFKIVNSLIALGTGAVSSVDEVLPYGGEPQPFKQWERDMSMREAIAMSNVPVYQGIARRIGKERMDAMLNRLGYGNGETGEVIDRFWLDGPLEISAAEQVRFLAQLASGTLPLPPEVQQSVRDILLLEENEGSRLYGKTGWAFAEGGGGLGWFVGWTDRDGEIRSFALNIDMTENGQASLRIPMAKQLLGQLGAW
ncbi:MAG: class D beta-lactamase [Parvibaculum sp.]|nr:class D beta-lactamase [Parvibaculum sp.]